MRMNRRNVLVGLGTIVAGGGAALGTGAFSSVEADRTVTINTDGDSAALLALTPINDGDTSAAITTPEGLLSINFDELGSGGVNLNATTTIGALTKDTDGNPNGVEDSREAINITNNGSRDVTVDLDLTLAQDVPREPGEVLQFFTDTSGAAGSDINDSGSNLVNFGNVSLDGVTLELAAGETVEVVIQVNTLGLDKTDVDPNQALFDSMATITATSG